MVRPEEESGMLWTILLLAASQSGEMEEGRGDKGVIDSGGEAALPSSRKSEIRPEDTSTKKDILSEQLIIIFQGNFRATETIS
ncbi:hypothetical protein DM02DRAFT_613751 [Periconia macrospinosa]|uniref:Uncharacterized protein n=1 Tax=Periconia macrospinosa TaxID=97972 RepID=A0A2V1DTJ8_9PLEO|nr:hypothetical protein DM02DRAFT_613751 [Periconia macrospinosa]